MLRNICYLLAVWLLLGCQPTSADYRVKYVQDGDSMVICCDAGKGFTIRLKDIDAPERGQPFADESRAYLRQLVENKPLKLIGSKKDKYGRKLVDLIIDGQSVNELMIKEGMAWRWRFSNNKYLKQLEAQAQQQRKGLWALPDSQRIEPWQWRQQRRN